MSDDVASDIHGCQLTPSVRSLDWKHTKEAYFSLLSPSHRPHWVKVKIIVVSREINEKMGHLKAVMSWSG